MSSEKYTTLYIGDIALWQTPTDTLRHRWYTAVDVYDALLLFKRINHPLSAVLIPEPPAAKSHLLSMLRSGLNMHGYRQTPVWVLVAGGSPPSPTLLTHGADAYLSQSWDLDVVQQSIETYWRQVARITAGTGETSLMTDMGQPHTSSQPASHRPSAMRRPNLFGYDAPTAPPQQPSFSESDLHQQRHGVSAPITTGHSMMGSNSAGGGHHVPNSSILNQLTPREREVLSYLCQGATNQTIAEELSISPTTVKNHLAHVFKKLRVQNRTQAATLTNEILNAQRHQ